jgi:hypothetical protein
MGWEHCRLDRSPTVGANWYRKFWGTDALLQRRIHALQEFNIEIRYKRGSENGVARFP